MVSSDGIHWIGHPSADDSVEWLSVAYGNGKYVATATHVSMVSTDGIRWSGPYSLPQSYFEGSLAYGNTVFMASVDVSATFQYKNIMVSSDGVSWSTYFAAGFNCHWLPVYGNTWIAVTSYAGCSPNSMTSNDQGASWAGRTSDLSGSNGVDSITYANGTFVGVGYDGAIVSTNGLDWSSSPLPKNSWNSVTYGYGMFAAVGNQGTNRTLLSPDGIHWTQYPASNEDNQWKSITYGNGRLVAVGRGTNATMIRFLI